MEPRPFGGIRSLPEGNEYAGGFNKGIEGFDYGLGLDGGAAPTHPFQLTDASTTSPAAAKVNVRFGMVNTLMPTGMDPVAGKTLTVDASGYVVLAVTTNARGVAISAALSIEEDVPDDTTTLGHIALGYAYLGADGVTVSQSVSGSLWHQMCAGIHLFGKV